jgi:hypothetical protein
MANDPFALSETQHRDTEALFPVLPRAAHRADDGDDAAAVEPRDPGGQRGGRGHVVQLRRET